MSQINQQFGSTFRVTDTVTNTIEFVGSDSSVKFQLEEDTEQHAIVSVTRSSNVTVVMDDCFKLNSEVSWYGGPQQKYQYWPIERLNLKDYSYITKEADNCGVAERYWLNSRGIFMYVDAEAPLFLNQAPMESLCLTVEKKLPYDTYDTAAITFNYKIGIAADARQAHMMAIDKFLKVHHLPKLTHENHSLNSKIFIETHRLPRRKNGSTSYLVDMGQILCSHKRIRAKYIR